MVPQTGSVLGGNITINGTGLPLAWPNSNWIIAINSTYAKMLVPVNVVFVNGTILVLAVPPLIGDTFSISITDPLNVVYTKNYIQSAANTPMITLTSPNGAIASGVSSTIILTKTSPSAAVAP